MPKKGERTAERVTVTCPCGEVFVVAKKRYADGRGRYCSRQCKDSLQPRRPRGKYNVKAVNRGWFGPDNPSKPQLGHTPWNKGRPTGVVPPNAFERKPVLTYGALHALVRRTRGPAKNQTCVFADDTCKGPMHWANISGCYEAVDDFKPMCQSHHWRHDKDKGYWGKSVSWPGRPQ